MPPASLPITVGASRPLSLIPANADPVRNAGVPGYQVVGIHGSTLLAHGL